MPRSSTAFLALDARDTEVYSSEVLGAYMRAVRRHGRRMLGMSVEQFIKNSGMANAGHRIYRDVELRVDVVDELDVRDETAGHYEFSYDPTKPNWYALLVDQIASVLELKADYDLSYAGAELRTLDGMEILLDRRRRTATLRLGTPSAARLVTERRRGSQRANSGKRRAAARGTVFHFQLPLFLWPHACKKACGIFKKHIVSYFKTQTI